MSHDSSETISLGSIAAECVALVASQFRRQLDWSVESLAELDAVCADLLAAGPLSEQRMELWWKLIGAYTGEVLIRAYGGQWINHESSSGAPAISVLGLTGFPFGIAGRVLSGEGFKSLASFGRSLPAIAANSARSE